MYKLFTIKRYIEQLIMFPFVLFGKCVAMLNPLQEEYDIYFFFPGYAIGGAERVNAEIVKSFADKKVIIIFTKKSPNSGMKHFFELPHVTIKEIGRWSDNKFIYWGNLMFRGVCSYYINKQMKKPVVFIGQCNFAYKLTPHLNRSIKVHELIHMYDPKFTWIWAPFIKFIDTRIIVGEVFKKKFGNAYKKAGIPLNYLDRLRVIFYRLEYLPETYHEREFSLPLKIYYAGRGGPQKRVWLILKIIEQCRLLNLPVEFKLAGPILNEMPKHLIDDRSYVGELQGGQAMYNFHKCNDILLMTSAWEGFPLVIMEAMAFGAIPLVTNIDAIPEHISNMQNGFLINEVENEELLISEAMEKITWMIANHNELNKISKNAFDYSVRNFSAEKFRDGYRKVLLD